MGCDQCGVSENIVITKGKTFSRVIRWESKPFIYKPITGISQAAPAVVTAVGHGAPDGWRGAVVSAGGMRQINAKSAPPTDSEMYPMTVLGVDSVGFNDINSAEFAPYTTGGYLQFYTPVDLAGFSAELQIRSTALAADPALLTLASPADIVLDNTGKTITLTIAASVTAALAFASGVYELELTSGSGVVTRLLYGTVVVEDEVVR